MAHLLTRRALFARLRLSRSAGYRLFSSCRGRRISSDTVVDVLNRARRGGQPPLPYRVGVPDDLRTAEETAVALEGAEVDARALLRWTRRARNPPPHFRINPRCVRFRVAEVEAWLLGGGRTA